MTDRAARLRSRGALKHTLSMLLLAAGFVWGALYLFGLQFSAGGVYPEYSSLRSDPMGAKLLYDSLAQLPGVTIERNYQPFEFLPARGFTLLLLAMKPDDLTDLARIERIAARGSRLVITLQAVDKTQAADLKPLLGRWGVRVELAPRSDVNHRLYFAAAKGWNPIERAGDLQSAIERNFGAGSVALFAGSTDFSNESTVVGDRLPLVAAALGPAEHVIFDEQHLGIAESGSVVALARRLHLTGLAIGLAICAGLFLWRNGATFPPAADPAESRPLQGRTAQAGLTTLLRRHVPPRELAAVCWREWLSANRGATTPERMQRAEEIANGGADPVAALHEIENLLHAKGEL